MRSLPEPTLSRLLIVDDEPSNLQVLAGILAPAYGVRVATSGVRALQLLHMQDIDLVLLDVQMPDCDGYAVLAAMQADSRLAQIPVIFVTGQGEIDDEARGLQAGAVDYLIKPVNAAIVLARVATHLELKRQRDLLKRLAMLDGLTGCGNRRCFDLDLAQAIARTASQQSALALGLLDIDCFKAYNDHYGHLAGDDALRAVAETIATTLGAERLYRYGGEEFAFLLPSESVHASMRRLLAAVRARALPHAASSVATIVTVSIGVSVQSAAPLGLTAAAWLAQADALLYQAKAAGRDRLALALPDVDVIFEHGRGVGP